MILLIEFMNPLSYLNSGLAFSTLFPTLQMRVVACCSPRIPKF